MCLYTHPHTCRTCTLPAAYGPRGLSPQGLHSLPPLCRRPSVAACSLDPDFDYDNVVLTRREFPYTMLGAFGRAGADAAGMPARR